MKKILFIIGSLRKESFFEIFRVLGIFCRFFVENQNKTAKFEADFQ